jgi:hypothetical protein
MVNEALIEAVEESLLLMAAELSNPKPVDAARIRRWVEILEGAGIRPEEVRPAAMRCLTSRTFFPSVGEFVTELRPKEDREEKEEMAWQKCRALVPRHGSMASVSVEDFDGDGAALWALSRMGYAALCRELTEENRLIKRSEFVRLYRLAVNQGASLAYLPGEAENQNRGFDVTPRMCGRSDWRGFPPSRGGDQALPPAEAGNSLVRAIAEMGPRFGMERRG